MHLSPDEEQAVLSLAEHAASRLPTPTAFPIAGPIAAMNVSAPVAQTSLPLARQLRRAAVGSARAVVRWPCVAAP